MPDDPAAPHRPPDRASSPHALHGRTPAPGDAPRPTRPDPPPRPPSRRPPPDDDDATDPTEYAKAHEPGRPPTREDEQKEQEDNQEAKELSKASGAVVYKAVILEGEEELERPTSALFYSGLAAGLSMCFSLVTEGLLRTHLPNAPWRPLITKFGYPVGFLIVVLGSQQLFTENTLTPVLPFLKHKCLRSLANVARLWSIVLLANLIGALAAAFALAKAPAFDPATRAAFVAIGHEHLAPGALHVFTSAIFAGWLIALMVWLLPMARSARVWIIILLTYVIGLGHFAHVIAGAVTVFTLAAAHEKAWSTVLLHFLLPALAGNILGGVTLVAALNHAQITSGKE